MNQINIEQPLLFNFDDESENENKLLPFHRFGVQHPGRNSALLHL